MNIGLYICVEHVHLGPQKARKLMHEDLRKKHEEINKIEKKYLAEWSGHLGVECPRIALGIRSTKWLKTVKLTQWSGR